ncbi:MAG: hypothetical protein PHW03_09730 [Eubacteriales bacterium]|nr:hypothetical protein [Eubacteriales bacterium]
MKTILTIRFEKTTVIWCIGGAVACVVAMEKVTEIIREYKYTEGALKSFSVEYKEV